MANCITKHIPNTITCCNLVCGCIAIVNALSGLYGMAFLFIILGAVFDFFDGMTARLLGVSSPIGKELDSLADVITFGAAPSTMIFTLLSTMKYPEALAGVSEYLPYVAFVMAAFSALRLAKFNIDERQSTSFIGLPTPANALFWGSLIVGGESWLASSSYNVICIVVLVFIMSYLLIAEIPMFALKFKTWGWSGNEVKYIFLLTCIPLLVFLKLSGFAAIIAWYVVLSALTDKKK